ncbi:hypothetical protein, partial [Gabonibacter massiliensis]|uniref:hypothetical protein n=1 Tax=Gabonibacter massiliensis TaxID=1720195 RepID=UPI0025707605
RLSIYRLPPFLTAKADAKITPFILTFQIFFTIFFELFFNPLVQHLQARFISLPLRKAGAKIKQLYPLFQIFITFFTGKNQTGSYHPADESFEKRKLTRFHARGKSRIDRFE